MIDPAPVDRAAAAYHNDGGVAWADPRGIAEGLCGRADQSITATAVRAATPRSSTPSSTGSNRGKRSLSLIRADIGPPHIPGKRGANAEVPRGFPRQSNIAVRVDCGPMAPVSLDGGTVATP